MTKGHTFTVGLNEADWQYLSKLAAEQGCTIEERASEMLANTLLIHERLHALAPIPALAVADKHHSIEAMD